MSELKRVPTLIEALIPVFFLIAMLATNVYLFGSGSLDGSNQMALLLAAAVAGITGIRIGVPWTGLVKSMVKSIGSAMPSILILLLIGALAGTWLISGIVPAMIYYGLQILNPTIFLFAACIICALVSVATGSSWSTIATVGIALLGIGQTLGLSEGVIGGAIISGAYFGDKMSPLSDTTNLAPAMAGTDLFTHIRYMTYTTVPSILITLVIFLIMGFFNKSSASVQDIEVVLSTIQGNFNINPWLFLVPVAVIMMIVKRVPALPALLVGVLLGGIFAIIFQPQIVANISEITDNIWKSSYVGVMKAIYGEVSITTENGLVNELLSSGGMAGMLNTVWLIICAMVFGGSMEAGGLLKRIARPVIAMAKSTGSLIASTVGTCIFFNATASDQYMAIVVPGRMYADTFKKRGLKPENLSRTLEDSGTVTSVLIPWNTCGATQASILGVATLTYLPFCFFNLISPFMTMIYGYIGIKIRYYAKGEKQEEAQAEALV
ncbi:MAG: Na+/H+ antiporter NhaC [Cyclobacteriaceae bacterium]